MATSSVLLTFKTREFHTTPFKLAPSSARLLSASFRAAKLSPEARLEQARLRASDALQSRKLRAERFIARVEAARRAAQQAHETTTEALTDRLQRAALRRSSAIQKRQELLADQHERVERIAQAKQAQPTSEALVERLQRAALRRSLTLRKKQEILATQHERVERVVQAKQAQLENSTEALAYRLQRAALRRSLTLRQKQEFLADEHERVERVAQAKFVERLAMQIAGEIDFEVKQKEAAERRREVETLRTSFSLADLTKVRATREAEEVRRELQKTLLDSRMAAAAERREKGRGVKVAGATRVRSALLSLSATKA